MDKLCFLLYTWAWMLRVVHFLFVLQPTQYSYCIQILKILKIRHLTSHKQVILQCTDPSNASQWECKPSQPSGLTINILWVWECPLMFVTNTWLSFRSFLAYIYRPSHTLITRHQLEVIFLIIYSKSALEIVSQISKFVFCLLYYLLANP